MISAVSCFFCSMAMQVHLFRDFRFWLVLFFALRMVGITNAPAEVAHNWRQASVNMVARNFVEEGPDVLHPKVDDKGAKSRISSMEFPLLNYSIYLVSLPFGFNHWYGRLINLLVTSLGIWAFFLLVRAAFNARIALASGLILLASNWFVYGRKIMPDTFSVSLVLIALWFVYQWLEVGGWWRMALFAVCCAAGLLAKLPAVLLLPILALPVFFASFSRGRKVVLALGAMVALVPALWWYFYWCPHLEATYGQSNFFDGVGFAQGLAQLADNLADLANRFYFDALKFSGFVAFVIGCVLLVLRQNRVGLGVLAITVPVLVVYMLKSGWTFAHHGYYIVPFVPVMALVAGFAVAQLRKQWLYVVALAVIMVEGVANQQHDLFIKPKHTWWLTLEATANKVDDGDGLWVVLGGRASTRVYFAHRRGWAIENEYVLNTEAMADFKAQGATVVMLDKTVWLGALPKLPYKKLLETREAIFYEL